MYPNNIYFSNCKAKVYTIWVHGPWGKIIQHCSVLAQNEHEGPDTHEQIRDLHEAIAEPNYFMKLFSGTLGPKAKLH